MTTATGTSAFLGWRVVAGAFVLAIFGWGLGFYGPPVYLEAVRATRGWSVGLVSAAVTVHFLAGALVIANLPRLYARFGIAAVTRAGAVSTTAGLVGWAMAAEPWQLFLATLASGAGWVTMGAAALNAIVSPWFVADRPKALSSAYNGASIGGVVFSPLWVVLISAFGFPAAAIVVGLVTVVVVFALSLTLFNRSPADLGQMPDGRVAVVEKRTDVTDHPTLAGRALWQDGKFRTLALGMALGLFAQIGLIAHLFSLILPALGATLAGVLMGLATAAAIAGRTGFGWLMPAGTDRRATVMLSHAIQILGVLILILAQAGNPVLIVAGVLLFGFGIGNATSLPPLIAQAEFRPEETGRVVALIVAMAQAAYAFAPAVFGLIRELAGPAGSAAEANAVNGVTIVVMAAAILSYSKGRAARAA